MKEGSTVVMVKPIPDDLQRALKAYGFRKLPVPSDTVHYIITAMEDMPKDTPFKVGIYLDAYPEYEKEGVAFDAEWFAEVEPLPPVRMWETEKVSA